MPPLPAVQVFILNYDEGGQFYDHHWSPTPPMSPSDGISTVNTTGEVFLGLPIGMGFRVPLLVVSPWSRGNYVVSQVFDHTSVVQLIEQRFGVHCPNISPWRRAVAGDMTSAFNFSAPDLSWPDLPDTSGYPAQSNQECDTLPSPVIPAVQAMPVPEVGTRLSRPLPYEFLVTDQVAPQTATIEISIANSGGAGAPFHLYDTIAFTAPKKYAVEAGKRIVDSLPVTAASRYSFALHGPNGFVRTWAGTASASTPSVALSYDVGAHSVVVTVSNPGPASAIVTITDNVYSVGGPWTLTVPSQQVATQAINVGGVGNWYDLSATWGGVADFSRRFMGRMETGETTTSDPAMGQGKPLAPLHDYPEPAVHPLVREEFRHTKRPVVAEHKDAEFLPFYP